MYGANQIRVRRRFDGQSITGILAVAACMGALVRKSDVTVPTLQLATAKKGFCLVRDVTDAATLAATLISDQVFPVAASVQYPDTIGNAVTASKVLEAEIEGPGLVTYSGVGVVGPITGATAVDTALSSLGGTLHVQQGGEEICGYLRQQLTPVDAANPARILVDYVAD